MSGMPVSNADKDCVDLVSLKPALCPTASFPSPPKKPPQGTSYPAALFANDFSTDVPPSQEGRSNTGGYALMWHDTGRPCRNYVPTSCLDTKSMEACTQDLTESLLAGAQSARGGGGLAPGTLAAAVAVPVVVAGECGGDRVGWEQKGLSITTAAAVVVVVLSLNRISQADGCKHTYVHQRCTGLHH